MGMRFRMILSIGLITSLMVGLTLVYTNMRQFTVVKKNLIEQTRINLQIISEYASPGMVSNDKGEATEVLKKLRKIPHFVSAVIYDTKLAPVVYLGNDSIQKISLGDKFFLDDILFRNDAMFFSVPLNYEGKRLGSLIAEIDLSFREKEKLEQIIFFIIIFVFLVLISMVLAFFAGGAMAKPLLLLSTKMRTISKSNDFEEYIDIFRKDEIGGLIHGYNYMLSQLAKWKNKQLETEAELRSSNEILEQKVAERTKEMHLAHEKVKRHLLNEQTILESLPYGIILVDKKSSLIKINQFALDLLGYTDKKPTYIAEIKNNVNTHRLQNLGTHEEVGKYDSQQIELICADGNTVPVLCSMMEIEYNGERVLLEAFVDISDLKKTQEELILAKEKAQESDRLKSAFLASVNHELRTPLNHILGFSELIQTGVSLEDAQSYATDIQSSGKNLLTLIEDVFDLALAEDSEIKVRNHTFRLMEQYLENKSAFESILRSSGKEDQIELKFMPTKEKYPGFYLGDKTKINLVLTHLFRNAVKFTNQGAIEIGFRMKEDHFLEYYIKDSGIGIPQEKLSIIFDFFRQGDDSLTRNYGGLGIGLAISLKLTRLLKGTLTVDSTPNQGSTFYLTIPIDSVSSFE